MRKKVLMQESTINCDDLIVIVGKVYHQNLDLLVFYREIPNCYCCHDTLSAYNTLIGYNILRWSFSP